MIAELKDSKVHAEKQLDEIRIELESITRVDKRRTMMKDVGETFDHIASFIDKVEGE